MARKDISLGIFILCSGAAMVGGLALPGAPRAQEAATAQSIAALAVDVAALAMNEVAEIRWARLDQAVTAGREGDYEKALADLADLRREYPGDQGILADSVTLTAWAGKDVEATELAADLNLSEAPEYALATAASAFRKSGKLAEAEVWYEEALRRFPHNLDIKIGLALTLGERGDPERGLSLLRKQSGDTVSLEDERRLAEARRYIRRMVQLPPYEVPPRTETPWRARQDEAVELARAGKLDEGLSILADLQRQHPRDQYLLGDYLLLLTWVPDHDRAIALARERQNLKLAPAYAIITVAESLAIKRDFAGARQYLETALLAQRRGPELLANAARLVALHGDFFRAAAWLDEAEAARLAGLGHLTAEIKQEIAYPRVQSLKDLSAAEKRLAAHPRDLQALWLKTAALSGVGGAHEALEIFHLGARLSAAEIHNIKLAAGRKESFWGEQLSDIWALERHRAWFERSLASLSRLAARPDCRETDGCQPLALQATVQPLYQLNRLKEATDLYERTLAAGAEPTDAVLLAAGGAYLGQRKPLLALAAYQQMAARRERVEPPIRDDDVYEAEKGVVWSYVEAEQLAEARNYALSLHRRLVSPTSEEGQPLPDEDWRKADSLNLVGQAELFTGWAGSAEDHFNEFLSQAPGNADALTSRSMTLAMRGLPRAAWRDAMLARLYLPDAPTPVLQLAHTLLDLRQWRAAEKLIAQLAPWSATDNSVRELERRWETHNLREFQFSTDWAASDSDNPGAINEASVPSVAWRLYSQPLYYNWRFFAGSAWAGGDFEEGTAHQEIALGGLEYRGRDLEIALEARSDRVEDRRFGLGLSGSYEFDDHWSLPFSFQKLSPETPLRARHGLVTADSAALGVGHYWNDYRWLNLEAMFLDFSDGNQRAALSLDFNQRLLTWYTHYLNGRLTAAASRNSQDAERAYFNPEADRELGLGLSYGSVIWRSYDRVLSHEVSADVGDYRQENYEADVIWNLGYSQSLDLGDRFSATYGVGTARRIYDGDPERDLSSYLNLNWRF